MWDLDRAARFFRRDSPERATLRHRCEATERGRAVLPNALHNCAVEFDPTIAALVPGLPTKPRSASPDWPPVPGRETLPAGWKAFPLIRPPVATTPSFHHPAVSELPPCREDQRKSAGRKFSHPPIPSIQRRARANFL